MELREEVVVTREEDIVGLDDAVHRDADGQLVLRLSTQQHNDVGVAGQLAAVAGPRVLFDGIQQALHL